MSATPSIEHIPPVAANRGQRYIRRHSLGSARVEPWVGKLEAGDADGAWDVLVERYRRLIIAAIRHYTTDPDDVMDVFACVCEALRENDLRRLRQYAAEPDHRAQFSTWLVSVVRNQTIDWFRHRDGRRRLDATAAALPLLQQLIFRYVFLDGHSHVEAYELIRTKHSSDLKFRAFLVELSAAYRAVSGRRGTTTLRELGRTPLEAATLSEDPPDTPDNARAILEHALAGLDPAQRLAVQLYVIDELPAAEIARIVGMPSATAVYKRVYRALEEVRARLERAGIHREDL